MKINENSNLQLRYNLDNFKNEFIPPYSYYKKFVKKNFLDKNYKGDEKIEVLVIAIELAGKIKHLRHKFNLLGNGKYYVLITGVKELSKNNEMLNYESNIEENEFRIEFEIDMNEIELKSNKLKKWTKKDEIIL